MDIYLSKNIIENLKLSNDAIGTYVALRKIYYSIKKRHYYVSLNMLVFELFGNCNYNRSDYKHIADGLNDLIENKLVTIVNKVTSSKWIFDLSELAIDKKKNESERFTIITEEELFFIMNYASESGKRGIDRLAFVRYFINLIGSINFYQGIYLDAAGTQKTDFVGYMTQEYLYKLSGISKNTLIKFNEILESNNIIYVYHHKKNKQESDGSYKAVTNHYGRYKDKEAIIKFALQYEEEKGIADKLTNAVSNRHKALANMYHELVNGRGLNYGEDLIREIYNYIHKCNMEIQKDIDDKKSQTCLTNSDLKYIKKLEGKLRNEKIFDKYVFLFGKQEVFNSDDNWGEPDPMEKDYPIEEILDMPTMSDVQNAPMNPTKVVKIKKPIQKENMQVPDNVVIQRYADDLYRHHEDDTKYEKSMFIADLSEKYPGLDDYEKYYYNAKRFFELDVIWVKGGH